MYNEILITLLLLFVFGSYKSDTLNCGIWGWSGKTPKLFDPLKFDILGMFNQSRGEDSCGRYINNLIEWGTDKKSKYSQFIIENGNSNIIERNPIAIGHTRKASSGGLDPKYAQPFHYKKNRNYSIILAHNGTLLNYKELGKKYGFHGKDINDTQMFARIINKSEFDALSEYNGSAAFIYYDCGDPNSIYIFRGESKWSKNSAASPSEERPLYMLKLDDQIYVSSIENSLKIIANKQGTISKIPPNEVFRLYKGKIESVKKINRGGCYQKDFYYNESYSSNTNNNHIGYNAANVRNLTITNNNANNTDKWKANRDLLENEPIEGNVYKHFIAYNKGRFYLEENKVNGIYNSSRGGYVNNINNTYSEDYLLCFIDGCLLPNPYYYQKAIKEIEYATTEIDKFKILVKYSVFPIVDEGYEINLKYEQCYIWDYVKDDVRVFSGIISPPFCKFEYKFANGNLTNRVYSSNGEKWFENSILEPKINVLNLNYKSLHSTENCPKCNGEGLIKNKICSSCNGEGTTKLSVITKKDEKETKVLENTEEINDNFDNFDDFNDSVIEDYTDQVINEVVNSVKNAKLKLENIFDAAKINEDINVYIAEIANNKLNSIENALKEYNYYY